MQTGETPPHMTWRDSVWRNIVWRALDDWKGLVASKVQESLDDGREYRVEARLTLVRLVNPDEAEVGEYVDFIQFCADVPDDADGASLVGEDKSRRFWKDDTGLFQRTS